MVHGKHTCYFKTIKLISYHRICCNKHPGAYLILKLSVVVLTGGQLLKEGRGSYFKVTGIIRKKFLIFIFVFSDNSK